MPDSSEAQLLQSAWEFYRAGRFAEAESRYREVLQRNPDHALALHLLGVLASETRRLEWAAQLIARAISLKPDYAQAHTDLGSVLLGIGQIESAIGAHRRAIELQPNSVEAHNNLGNALEAAGRKEEAIAAYREALRLNPQSAAVIMNLGRILEATGRAAEALVTYQTLVRLAPGDSAAHVHLGNAFQLSGNLGDAVKAYRAALQLDSSDPATHYNLARALHARGGFDEAIAAYRRTISLLPGHAPSYHNLGDSLQAAGRIAEAISAYGQALQLEPQNADSYNNLGNALASSGRLDEAIAAFEKALQLKPGHAAAWHNLGNSYRDQARLELAVNCYRKAVSLAPESAEIRSTLLHALLFEPTCSSVQLLAECVEWDRRHAQPLKAEIKAHRNERRLDRPLRIGYVSPDFREHSTGRNLLPLIREHDRARFKVYCYSDVSRQDAVTAQYRSFADYWRSGMGVTHEGLAEIIREDQIDILVDMTMHMGGNRLLTFARKPAPIQVTFGAYPSGTGLEAIDYRFTDPYLDPEGATDGDYREKSVRLPFSYWCYDQSAMTVGMPELELTELSALKADNVTFGCLNNFCKVNDDVLRIWAAALNAVGGSRLILLAPEGACREAVLDLMKKEGIARERLEFVARLSRADYLRTYHRIDLCLDTVPYNGHTTSLDATWMGVPTITLIGQTVVGRAGYSQLSNLGLSEYATRTTDEFTRVTVKLAKDLDRLAALRGSLRERLRNSPVGDAIGFTRAVEAAYEKMWREWCNR